MTIRHQIELDITAFLVAGALVGFAVAFYSHPSPKVRLSVAMPVAQDLQNLTPTPTFVPKIDTSSQVSPDGAKKLTLTTTTNKDETKTYAFTTAGVDNANQQSIYSITLPQAESMNIPFNTWSPDNAYVFLERSSSSGTSALVMKANGQPFADGQQSADVTVAFAAKSTGNAYKETTGWASETLLIVNTTKPDGSKGPSYWYEVPSKAIIQLSTEF